MPRPRTTLEQPNSPELWGAARRLIEEYATSLHLDLAFQDFAHEIESLSTEYGPPYGCFILASQNGTFMSIRAPTCVLALAEFVDVGISEHTEKVCDASRTNALAPVFASSEDRRCVPRGSRAGRLTFIRLEVEMVKGLGTVIYHVTDLDTAKAWYSAAFQQTPYFDQPFYVGFNVAGYELGLDPNQSIAKVGPGGSVAYWRVPEIDAAVRHFVSIGARVAAPAQDVGDGIKVATVADPFGNLIGLIENPHFKLSEASVE